MNRATNIVFIADRVNDYKTATIQSTNLEFLSDGYFNALYNSLNEISNNVTYYQSPENFLKRIAQHKDAVVLSVWSGEKSRNRKALVPSICEAYNIPYVGADSYLHLISADKHLTKTVCSRFGINSARDVLISSSADFWLLNSLKYPIIIKPNMEGGSIGIFQENVVENIVDARKLCELLLENYSPIIAEEYLPGQEVIICIAGINKKIDVFQVMRQRIGNKTYFTHEIFGAEIKKINNASRVIEVANEILPYDEKIKILNLYNSLGKAEVMRIDGRINENEFRLIELTPDCSLNITGSVSLAFQNSGYTYTEMLELLITNSIKSWEDQNANRL